MGYLGRNPTPIDVNTDSSSLLDGILDRGIDEALMAINTEIGNVLNGAGATDQVVYDLVTQIADGYQRGDVDNDGSININDMIDVLRHIADLEYTPKIKEYLLAPMLADMDTYGDYFLVAPPGTATTTDFTSTGIDDNASSNKLTVHDHGTNVVGTAYADITKGDEMMLSSYNNTAAITGNAVDVFIYDTSNDSDGGAWRKRTQATSWYNETLNTATRGSRKDFPSVAVIVATNDSVIIYDGDTPDLDMWMVFNTGNNVGTILSYSNAIGSVYMLNGVLGAGIKQSAGGFTRINFISEEAFRHRDGTSLSYPLSGAGGLNIATRNNSYNFVPVSEGALVNTTVNDVAMTVLPNAPIDSTTGLPIPTIAVATDGGVSVIKDDGSVKSLSGGAVENITINERDEFITTPTNHSDTILIKALSTTDTNLNWNTGLRGYSYNPATGLYPFLSYRQDNTVTTPEGFRFSRNTGGVSLMDEDFTNPRKSLLADITSTYNSGYMTGDIKGAWLADTDDTNVVDTELVTNGTFDTDITGWSNFAGSVAHDATNGGRIAVTSAGNYYGGVQTITAVVGKTYALTFTSITGTTNARIRVGSSTGGTDYLNESVGDGTHTYYFTVSSTDATVRILPSTGAATGTCYYDNISVKLADADRSVNANGLQVNGTITKSPVATGAELVAYSGFSGANYLVQPYNADLDFGTGDFSVMGWVYLTADTDFSNIFDTGYGQNEYINMSIGTSRQVYLRTSSGGAVSDTTSSSAVPLNTWTFLCVTRTANGAVQTHYINGSFDVSGTVTARDLQGIDKPTIVGLRADSAKPFLGSLALLRISGTAPTAEQIAKIYEDEKFLFQENAKCTLNGASDAVQCLAYDDSNSELVVGTSSSLSVFKGLRRVDEELGNFTEVSQQGGMRIVEKA